ncbi:MAG: sodium/proline symporter PutP [Clostridiales bacterium]|jgi:sodium/proline symporter|nr:sodium/proline symporter PutP [Clostridiales bacterium]
MGMDKVQIVIAMCIYVSVVIGIGLYYAKRASQSSRNFLIGGRSLGPWVTAMAAEASDMSGWLLMGLPGLAYWCGLGEAFWTALGLCIGTYLNWLLVAKRLRIYSHVAGDAITIPDFLSNRFKEEKKTIMTIAALFILVFFVIYAASCFVGVGKLFSMIFQTKYIYTMIIGALFVISYTFVGGFLAESASDFLQGIVMFFALTIVVIFGVAAAGGLSSMIDKAKAIPGFFDIFTVAQPKTLDGIQQVEKNTPLFLDSINLDWLFIISTLSWGLGYFGMPHILVKFMAINKSDNIKFSRRIATIWVIISLAAAVIIGLAGRILYPDAFLTQSSSENIFILMSTEFFISLLAGVVLAGILAAIISSADSYLLLSASSLSKNIYQGLINKEADDKAVLRVTRITLLCISLVAILIALDENSVIFKVVSFAWAGFGATFGPIILFSLFWEKTTRAGAIAGMIAGGATVFIWKLLLNPLGGIFGIYELLPAFLISCVAIIITSLLSEGPSEDVKKEFRLVKTYKAV